MNENWLVPTVIVGAAGLAVQGLKAGWDLYLAIVSQQRATNALRLQEIAAVVNLVDGLPIDSARKAARKIEIIRNLKYDGSIAAVYEVVQKAIDEV